MKIEQKYSYTLATEDTILSATLSKENEIVMVLSNADVIRHNLNTNTTEVVFTLNDSMNYSDGGFDLTSPISIYTLDDIIVVVNDFKCHGYIHKPNDYTIHISRGNYHADRSKYPIALYKDNNGVPHLICSENWNHIDIVNLSTRQILTVSKSLIEEGAEQRHLDWYKNNEERYKSLWPTSIDYFYGEIILSPDKQLFLNTGWVWGSQDRFHIYDIQDFITNPRISYIYVNNWEHESRSACWVNNNTIAVEYDPALEEEYDEDGNDIIRTPAEKEFKEIHFYQIVGNSCTLSKKIKLQDKDIKYYRMYFDTTLDAFVLINSTKAVYIVSKKGEVLHQDNTIRTSVYNTTHQQFLELKEKSVSVYKLV